MTTRSEKEFHGRLLDCEKYDLLLYIVQEVQNIFAKIASLETWRKTTIDQENKGNENGDNQELPNDNQDIESNDGGPKKKATKPSHMIKNHAFNMATFHDDIIKRVRIDVPNFTRKLNPRAFID